MLPALRAESHPLYGGISFESGLFNSVDPSIGLKIDDMKSTVEQVAEFGAILSHVELQNSRFSRPYSESSIPESLKNLIEPTPNGMKLTNDGVEGDLKVIYENLFPELDWDLIRSRFDDHAIEFTPMGMGVTSHM